MFEKSITMKYGMFSGCNVSKFRPLLINLFSNSGD